jgi:hypothetical protein
MTKKPTALVIGNAAYSQVGSLANPTNDADDIATKLQSRGFSVVKKTDCTNKGMDKAIKEFRTSLAGADVALFFFAGHGMQIDGENYLAAVDTDAASEIDAKHSSLPLNRVIETMEKSPAATKIIILDACRDNPFERRWHRSSATRGLAPVYAPRGTIIAYATSPGQVALDGKGRNGAYTSALLKHIDTPDCSLESMFKQVRNTLSAATKGKQISWEHTSLAGEFFFNLSLGARIDEYSDVALSDRLFVLDDAKLSHRVIQGLKTSDWYLQNPAIAKITPDLVTKAHTDSLFVVGRNIYQAACGGSNGAIEYLTGFMTKTGGVDDARRKAILDGILFEIFFDSRGQLRDEPKNRRHEDAFDLQQYKELAGSFAFISECLLAYPEHFHAVPGKNRVVTIDVVTNKKAGNTNLVQQVMFDGSDIFWVDDSDIFTGFGVQGTPGYEEISINHFEKKLANEMVVPTRLLKVTYTFDTEANRRLMIAEGGTVRKR